MPDPHLTSDRRPIAPVIGSLGRMVAYPDLSENACVYCGLVGDTIDHVPPRSVRLTLLNLGLAARYPFIQVRACRECNSALGARPLWTVRQRRAWLKRWLRRRYRRHLHLPDWSAHELTQLSPSLRGEVLRGLALRDLIRQRLAWPADRLEAPRRGTATQVDQPRDASRNRSASSSSTPTPRSRPGRTTVETTAATCPGCGESFTPARPNQRHCRPSCRRRALEDRRAAQDAALTAQRVLLLFE